MHAINDGNGEELNKEIPQLKHTIHIKNKIIEEK
jgi:hypothetical protein